MGLSLVVFDCDGVILQSVEVKTRAFGEIVADYGPAAVAKMTEYHLAHGGVSRFRKFEWFYREFLGREASEDELQELNLKFKRLVFDGVLNAPLVPGIMEALALLHALMPMYVASGTPQDELEKILEARKLAPYFKGIYGAPPGKTELLRRIVEQEGVMASDTLMVGDSSTDLAAAEAVGTRFFGIGDLFANSCYPWGVNCPPLSAWLTEAGCV